MFLSKATTADFYLYWPETVSLALYQRDYATETYGAAIIQPTCRRLEPKAEWKDEAKLSSSARTLMFEIWDRSQTKPKNGDVLEEQNGTRWTVQIVNELVFGNLWQCTCVKEN